MWVKVRAHRFWNRHQFRRRGDVPRVQRAFLDWYRHDYIAPRQADTPAQLRRGHCLHRLPARYAEQLPDPLPICAGQIHTVRRVLDTGFVSFLNSPVRVGKRYAGRYIWLTLETARQRLTLRHQPRAEAEWRQLKQLDFPLTEAVVPVPEQFVRLHN